MDRRIYTFEDVDVHSESPKAFHCQIGGLMFWVPKSQIKECDFATGHLVTTNWWAETAGADEAYEAELRRQEAERQQQPKQQQAPPVIQLPKAQTVYRKLVFKWHPDRNPDSGEMMRDLNELWQAVLADLKKLH